MSELWPCPVDKPLVRKLRERIASLEAERRQNALDGQAALDEANNRIFNLEQELETATGKIFKEGFWGRACARLLQQRNEARAKIATARNELKAVLSDYGYIPKEELTAAEAVRWVLTQERQYLYEAQNPMLPNGESITIPELYRAWQSVLKERAEDRAAIRWLAHVIRLDTKMPDWPAIADSYLEKHAAAIARAEQSSIQRAEGNEKEK